MNRINAAIASACIVLGAAMVSVLVAPAAHAQSILAGVTPAAFRVTPSGAAEYSIPVPVPPGIAGIEPKLALVYSSQSGNGLLGIGWSLAGLSAVHRCPRTVAQDGVVGGIHYDSNDRFCLDGHRLMATSGTYGADGTEYRTERESFSKVISYGTAGNGPAWFKVWTKSGQVFEYGNSADSRIEAQGKTSARVWAMNKLKDSKGNYLTVSYVENSSNGEYRPDRIDYTGNSLSTPVLSPGNSVRFEYEARSDQIQLFQSGSAVNTTMRMTKLKTFVGLAQVGEFRLAYDNAGPVGRSRITSVKQCDPASNCLPATVFAWSPQPSQFGNTQFSSPTFNSNSWFTTGLQPRMWPIDINGDGLLDLFGVDADQLYVQLNSPSGFQSIAVWGSTMFDTNMGWFTTGFQPRVWLIDMNGDGRPDLLGVDGDSAYVQLNTGSGFQTTVWWGYQLFDTNTGWFTTSLQPRVWPIDVNGDGLADLLAINSNQVLVHLNTGSGLQDVTWGYTTFNTNTGWFTTSLHPRVWAVDVNGDGLPDLVGVNSNQIFVQLNTGTGFQDAVLWGTNAFDTNAGWFTTALRPRVWLMDVNGDGLPDLVGVNSNQVFVQLNTGTGFQDATWTYTIFDTNAGWFSTSLQQRVWLVDVNGDGLPDLVGVNSNQIFVQLNTGTGFQAATWVYTAFDTNAGWFSTGLVPRLWPRDLAGDGTIALLGIDGTNRGTQLLTGPSGFAPWTRITSITDGLGAVTALDYKPLPQQGVYTRDSGASAATYPNVDVQGPMYVASSANRSNAIGSTITSNYKYGGAKSNYRGRGLLGFRWMETNDPATGITARSEFRQDWPYVGMPSLAKTTQSSGAVLSQVLNSYSCNNPATGAACTVALGNRYFPFLSQSVQTGADLSGATLPTLTITNSALDVYGNVGIVNVTTGDGYSRATTNTYANDAVNWFLGRLTRSTVQSTTP